jgi:hypothetical protein
MGTSGAENLGRDAVFAAPVSRAETRDTPRLYLAASPMETAVVPPLKIKLCTALLPKQSGIYCATRGF